MLLPFTGIAQHEGTGEVLRLALVVVDVQNAFLPLMSEQEQKIALRVINGAIWFFCEEKLLVARVYHSDPLRGPAEGTREFAFSDAIMPEGDDARVVKRFPSAFIQTDLDRILKEKGCNTVFLCGLSDPRVVLATYFGARLQGLHDPRGHHEPQPRLHQRRQRYLRVAESRGGDVLPRYP